MKFLIRSASLYFLWASMGLRGPLPFGDSFGPGVAVCPSPAALKPLRDTWATALLPRKPGPEHEAQRGWEERESYVSVRPTAATSD